MKEKPVVGLYPGIFMERLRKITMSRNRRKKVKAKAVPLQAWSGPEGYSKAVPLQAWSGPEGSRKLRVPDFLTTARDGSKFVNITHRPYLPPGNSPGNH
jgi:hypothetical protein